MQVGSRTASTEADSTKNIEGEQKKKTKGKSHVCFEHCLVIYIKWKPKLNCKRIVKLMIKMTRE